MKITATIILFLLLATSPVGAVDTRLPEPLVSQDFNSVNNATSGVKVVVDPLRPSNQKTYYGGFAGNEAVLNYIDDTGQTMRQNFGPNIKFDGNDYVSVPTTSPSLSAGITNANAITIAAWIKPSVCSVGASDYSTVVTKTNYYYLHLTPACKLAIYLNGVTLNPVPSPGPYQLSDGTIPLNIWTHIAFTYNGSALNIYINGSLDKSISASGTITGISPEKYLGIGANLDSSGNVMPSMSRYFNGSVDEVSINARVLSGAAIASLYNGGAVIPTDLKAYWNFNEGTGTTAADNTTNNNDGTLTGATWEPGVDSSSLFGFDQITLTRCINGIVTGSPSNNCFVKNTAVGNVDIMNSRTYVNSAPSVEIAAMYYPSTIVSGDVYGDLGNFAFWGKSVHQQGSGDPDSDASWKFGSYVLNPNAQSTMSGTEYDKYSAKITQLKNEAQTQTHAQFQATDLYLQSSSDINVNNSSDAGKYPEGKVWRCENKGAPSICYDAVAVEKGSLTIPQDSVVTYHGKGTIIVDHTLRIQKGVTFRPADPENDRLGFIVLGHTATANGNVGVVVRGDNTVRASIFAPDGLIMFGNTSSSTDGDNINLIGSFVATNFTNIELNTNIRVFYDSALSSAWPPGFRYLNMPHASD